ncbi:MAG: hypothetical protein HFJ45_08040 [Clostridia bacterium]|nr:hypothetical protein [Clostridia bacterium]
MGRCNRIRKCNKYISRTKKEINDVGKKVFTGESVSTGSEYVKGVEIIQRDLERENSDKEIGH